MSVHLQAACLKDFPAIVIEQEQFCASPRTELCEAKVGQDSHKMMPGTRRTGAACLERRGKWWLL